MLVQNNNLRKNKKVIKKSKKVFDLILPLGKEKAIYKK